MNLCPEGSQKLQDWELMSAGRHSHFALSLLKRSQVAHGPCRLFAPKWEEQRAPSRDISEPVVMLTFSCKPFAAFHFPADRPLTHKSLPAVALVISRLLRCERLRYCCSSPLQTQADVTTLVTDHSFASSSYAHISVHEN